jgi:hypothetical protein
LRCPSARQGLTSETEDGPLLEAVTEQSTKATDGLCIKLIFIVYARVILRIQKLRLRVGPRLWLLDHVRALFVCITMEKMCTEEWRLLGCYAA